MDKAFSTRKKETGVDFLEEEVNTNNLINKIALSLVVVLSISMLGFLSFFYSYTINPENNLMGFLVSDLGNNISNDESSLKEMFFEIQENEDILIIDVYGENQEQITDVNLQIYDTDTNSLIHNLYSPDGNFIITTTELVLKEYLIKIYKEGYTEINTLLTIGNNNQENQEIDNQFPSQNDDMIQNESFVEDQVEDQNYDTYDDPEKIEYIEYPQEVDPYKKTQSNDSVNTSNDGVNNTSNDTNSSEENQLSTMIDPGIIFTVVLVVLFIVIIGLILSKNSHQRNSKNNSETEIQAILRNNQNNSQINETNNISINNLTSNTFDDLTTSSDENVDENFNSNNDYDFSEEILKKINEKSDEKKNLTGLEIEPQDANKEKSEKEKIERLISLLKMLIEDDDVDIDEKKKHLEKTKGIIETITDQNIKTRLNTIVTVFEAILEI